MRVWGKIGLLGLLAVASVCQTAFAQRHIYRSYTKSDGLPSDYVFHITQAPTGEMWFGTERGAARYDGNQFRTFTTEDGLPHNFVYAIHVDSRGRTWFGTAVPVPAYLTNGRILSPAIEWGGQNGIYDITETASGVVIFRFSNGLGLLDGDRYRFHPMMLHTTKESRIQIEPAGSFLITDSRNVLRIRIGSGLEIRTDTLVSMEAGSNFMTAAMSPAGDLYVHHFNDIRRYRLVDGVWSIQARHRMPMTGWMRFRSDGGRPVLIVGTRSLGLQTISEDGQVRPLLTDQSKDEGHVSALHLDYEGNLWAAFLGEGVEKISNWNTVRVNRQSGLSEDNIWRLEPNASHLFAMSKTGIERLDAGSLRSAERLPIRTNVRGALSAGDSLFVGTMTDLRLYLPGKPYRYLLEAGEGINDIRRGPDGSIWVATAGGWIYRWFTDGRSERHPVENGVERIVVTGEDVWWLTSDDGAHRYRDGVIQPFRHETGELPSNAVTSLTTVNGTTLIGTKRGLVRLDSHDNSTWITPAEGLVGVSVEAVFRRDSTSAWIATNEKLHVWNASGIDPVGSLATLRSELASAHWHAFDPERSRWYMATPDGIVMVDLTTPAPLFPAPKVSISGFRIQDSGYPAWMADEVTHTGARTSLEFTFHGLTFIEEAATRYIVKLDGVDEAWSQPQRTNTVRYANLPPGTYTFRVKAVNAENMPSDAEATLRLTLHPPLWMHPGTRVVAAMLLLLLLAAFTRWRIRSFQMEVERRNEQRQFEAIQRIGASISHDIRNTVFSLNLLAKNLEVRFNNPEFRRDAIETIESSLNYLTKLVDQLQQRSSAPHMSAQDVRIRDIIDSVLKRLPPSVAEVRYQIDWPAEAVVRTDADSLGRILDNLIRNATEAMAAGGTIRIHGEQDASGVRICVTDQGPGMSADFVRNRLFRPFQSTKTKGLGIGLYTCRELAIGLGGRLDVESVPGSGTTFCLWLPSKNE